MTWGTSTPLYVVSEILGHASITITKDVYGHLVEGDRRAVAAFISQALFGPEPVRAENLVHGSDQQGCFPGRPAVMINGHVPGVRVPHDHAGCSVAAAVTA